MSINRRAEKGWTIGIARPLCPNELRKNFSASVLSRCSAAATAHYLGGSVGAAGSNPAIICPAKERPIPQG
jgi:hypothetical protein